MVWAGIIRLNARGGVPAGTPGAAALAREGMSILLRTLYPVAPHATWTLWNELGFVADHGDLLDAPWPEVDPKALVQDEIELVSQVNGKRRGKLVVPAGARKAAIGHAPRASAAVAQHANGAP